MGLRKSALRFNGSGGQTGNELFLQKEVDQDHRRNGQRQGSKQLGKLRLISKARHGIYFVPEGQHDRSLSVWDKKPFVYRRASH
jgi:hypothetical protein